MPNTNSSERIRQDFLDFFAEKDHTIVPSAPIYPHDDPTLLFTNAGMNQFKDVFLGTGTRSYLRAADTQKVLRVSGKHNDLEEVGHDTYHHTFFEMLGNWSFGDYFKKDAIAWAWELLVDRWGLEPGRLYATVHEGDDRLGLAPDTESAELWKSETGIDPSHVLFGSTKDNFWMMGETGPSGPCSEIHIDLRPESDRREKPGRELVNADHPQVIEIWNLVFIQYNAQPGGALQPLRAKHVDTGMGLERVVAALDSSISTYDTDLFAPILQRVADLSTIAGLHGYDNIDSDDPERIRIAMRVVADHIRAIAFAVADGVLPSNEGRGYVIRRILRRAVRFGYQVLGFRSPFLHKLVEPLAAKMGGYFKELDQKRRLIEDVIRAEEEGFLRTLDAGIVFFETLAPYAEMLRDNGEDVESKLGTDQRAVDLLSKAFDGTRGRSALTHAFVGASGGGTLPGEVAFLLHDTYGFPIDLTRLMARERGLSVDMDRFETLMEEQRDRARSASQFKDIGVARSHDDGPALAPTRFLGYESLETPDAAVLEANTVDTEDGPVHHIVLDKTPFYAESGGQVGDTGILLFGDDPVRVVDTRKSEGIFYHIVDRMPAQLDAPVQAVVDAERREQIKKHHTATHLLHAALRNLLGTHVEQRGSLVAPDRLRFDFSHFERVGEKALAELTDSVNHQIQRNVAGSIETGVPINEARARGALMLFGEKYGETVRVVTFDPDYSVELCGGTHVGATGEIGLFQFVSEGSIASGIRRVEAVVGRPALELVHGERRALHEVRHQFKGLDRSVSEEVADLIAETKRLQKEVARYREQELASRLDGFVDGAETVGDVKLVRGAY
ncbi:MAG TPA: alanine--tRNA ligase, partial [Rhodothermales bacterium]|nr:alanine--tRNA ligase [Rhodothermales bacterium]